MQMKKSCAAQRGAAAGLLGVYDLKLSMLEEWPGCNLAFGLM